MKRIIFFLFVPVFIFAESMYSPTWGFILDLPEGYEYNEGDAKDRFSFSGPGGAIFDVIVYNGTYSNINELVKDVNKRISNRGDTDFFKYRERGAAVIELDFGNFSGWGLCIELDGGEKCPMLLALAYGPSNKDELNLFHVSALDSIIPSPNDRLYPGPIIEYSYPRGKIKQVPIASSGLTAMIYGNDAEAAQVLIEREFNILTYYINSPRWKEAWLRYYRFIYRDSCSRIIEPVSALVQKWGGYSLDNDKKKLTFSQKALEFVQNFKYERNSEGSDFLNLVTAVTEGRGDCDSRAMLWAIILANADIRSAMMVSSKYSHAMGLADIEGTGARFESYGTKWLVAETTDKVDIGLIGENVSDPQNWIGIIFE